MRKHSRILALLVLLVSVLGCENDEKPQDGSDKYDLSLVQTDYHYIDVDSTVGQVPYFSTIFTVNDTDFMAIQDRVQKKIHCHSLDGQVYRSISVANEEFGNLASFYIHNWDSIYIYALNRRDRPPQPGKELFLINSDGEITKEIPVGEQINLYDPLGTENDPYSESVYSDPWNSLSLVDNRLLIGLLPYDGETDATKKPYGGEIDIRNDRFSYHPLFQDLFTAQSVIYFQYPIKHVDPTNKKILFGFRGTPTLKVWDFNSDPEEKPVEHTIQSDYLSLQNAPSVDEAARAPNSSMLQMQIHWGTYGKILQSPEDIYVRFVYYARQDSLFEVQYGNRKVPGPNNLLCSIVLFDKNFQKRGESGTFEGLVDKNAGFSKDGTFYVLDYSEEGNEVNRLRYAKFRIEAIKPMQNES